MMLVMASMVASTGMRLGEVGGRARDRYCRCGTCGGILQVWEV